MNLRRIQKPCGTGNRSDRNGSNPMHRVKKEKSFPVRSVIEAAALFVAISWFAVPVQATNDGGWLGMDHPYGNDSRDLNPGYPYTSFVTDITAVGIKMTRQGLTGNDFCNGLVAYYQSHGVAIHNVLWQGNPMLSTADFKAKCVETMTKYKGKIFYYIVGNEPDLVGQADPNRKPLKADPQQAVDYTRAVYEASRVVDPTGGIKVESMPVSSPETPYLQKMIDLGVADVCDYIGVHVYSNQINDGRLSKPWEFLRQHNVTKKPVAASECGMPTIYAPKELTEEQKFQWQAEWLDFAYEQFKRYGYSNLILFESSSLGTSKTVAYDFLRGGAKPPTTPTIIQATYDEIRLHLNQSDPAVFKTCNFDFENPDPSGLEYRHGWVVYHNCGEAVWDASKVDLQSKDGPHSGTHCLRFDTSATGTQIHKSAAGALIVRRVVKATPNKPVTITAWVYSHNGGESHLKALGFNAANGLDEADAKTSTQNRWQQLTLTCTPTNPWVVIELSSVADGQAGSYVKFDDVNMK